MIILSNILKLICASFSLIYLSAESSEKNLTISSNKSIIEIEKKLQLLFKKVDLTETNTFTTFSENIVKKDELKNNSMMSLIKKTCAENKNFDGLDVENFSKLGLKKSKKFHPTLVGFGKQIFSEVLENLSDKLSPLSSVNWQELKISDFKPSNLIFKVEKELSKEWPTDYLPNIFMHNLIYQIGSAGCFGSLKPFFVNFAQNNTRWQKNGPWLAKHQIKNHVKKSPEEINSKLKNFKNKFLCGQTINPQRQMLLLINNESIENIITLSKNIICQTSSKIYKVSQESFNWNIDRQDFLSSAQEIKLDVQNYLEIKAAETEKIIYFIAIKKDLTFDVGTIDENFNINIASIPFYILEGNIDNHGNIIISDSELKLSWIGKIEDVLFNKETFKLLKTDNQIPNKTNLINIMENLFNQAKARFAFLNEERTFNKNINQNKVNVFFKDQQEKIILIKNIIQSLFFLSKINHQQILSIKTSDELLKISKDILNWVNVIKIEIKNTEESRTKNFGVRSVEQSLFNILQKLYWISDHLMQNYNLISKQVTEHNKPTYQDVFNKNFMKEYESVIQQISKECLNQLDNNPNFISTYKNDVANFLSDPINPESLFVNAEKIFLTNKEPLTWGQFYKDYKAWTKKYNLFLNTLLNIAAQNQTLFAAEKELSTSIKFGTTFFIKSFELLKNCQSLLQMQIDGLKMIQTSLNKLQIETPKNPTTKEELIKFEDLSPINQSVVIFLNKMQIKLSKKIILDAIKIYDLVTEIMLQSNDQIINTEGDNIIFWIVSELEKIFQDGKKLYDLQQKQISHFKSFIESANQTLFSLLKKDLITADDLEIGFTNFQRIKNWLKIVISTKKYLWKNIKNISTILFEECISPHKQNPSFQASLINQPTIQVNLKNIFEQQSAIFNSWGQEQMDQNLLLTQANINAKNIAEEFVPITNLTSTSIINSLDDLTKFLTKLDLIQIFLDIENDVAEEKVLKEIEAFWNHLKWPLLESTLIKDQLNFFQSLSQQLESIKNKKTSILDDLKKNKKSVIEVKQNIHASLKKIEDKVIELSTTTTQNKITEIIKKIQNALSLTATTTS